MAVHGKRGFISTNHEREGFAPNREAEREVFVSSVDDHDPVTKLLE
jgi:hypothetical protein